MNRQNYKNKRRHIKLDRIERKCDRILSELLIIRQRLTKRPDELDTAIDRMHDVARKMRAQCEREREIARHMFINKHIYR